MNATRQKTNTLIVKCFTNCANVVRPAREGILRIVLATAILSVLFTGCTVGPAGPLERVRRAGGLRGRNGLR